MSTLAFRRSGGSTTVVNCVARAPIALSGAFHLDATPTGLATVFLQSTQGALIDGDAVSLHVHAEPEAQAQVWGATATTVHRSGSAGGARQHVSLTAGAWSLLEYLPGSTLLMDGAALRTSLHIRADPAAKVVVGETFASIGPDPSSDSLTTELVVNRGDELAWIERSTMLGDDPSWRGIGALGAGNRAHGYVALIGATPAALAETISLAMWPVGALVGYGELARDAGFVIRFVATDAGAARRVRDLAWRMIRTATTGGEPAPR